MGRVSPACNPKDVERTYWEFEVHGVQFSEELRTTSWDKYALLRDPYGNEFEMS